VGFRVDGVEPGNNPESGQEETSWQEIVEFPETAPEKVVFLISPNLGPQSSRRCGALGFGVKIQHDSYC